MGLGVRLENVSLGNLCCLLNCKAFGGESLLDCKAFGGRVKTRRFILRKPVWGKARRCILRKLVLFT